MGYTQRTQQDQSQSIEILFDSQITTLRDRGTPEQIVESLAKQRDQVISKASEMTFRDGHIPILPVIPLTCQSPDDLMSAVRHNGTVGYTRLNPTDIIDKVETPDKPYYIYDVEDGESTRGKDPEDIEDIFESELRLPLTVVEAIALAKHTDVLSRHNGVGSWFPLCFRHLCTPRVSVP